MTDSMRSEDGGRFYLQVILGALAVAFIGFQAWLANALIDGQSITSDRLTKIETTMAENREERQATDRDLRTRLERIERDFYVRRNGERE